MATRKLSRTVDYRITEALESPSFVGKKVRLQLLEMHEDIREGPLGFLYDLQGYMLTGPNRGEVVELPPVKLLSTSIRKCYCPAYPFPHAPGFGACKDRPKWADEGAPEGIKLEELFQ